MVISRDYLRKQIKIDGENNGTARESWPVEIGRVDPMGYF